MKRWSLAVTVLLGGAFATAQADYLKITYNLGATKKTDNTTVATAPPIGGGAFGAGGPGRGGRQGGGGATPGGGPGRGGAPGGPGGRNAPPPKNVKPSDLQEDGTPALSASAIIEYREARSPLQITGAGNQQKYFPMIVHKYGTTGIHPTADITVDSIKEKDKPIPSLAKRYLTKVAELTKDLKPTEGIDKRLDLAKWCLQHYMLKQFSLVMADTTLCNPKHPAVVAYQKVRKDMSVPLTQDDSAIIWKGKVGPGFKTKTSLHYTLCYDAPGTEPPEVDNFLTRLEENFKGFFYWFAMNGHALQIPDKRLVAFLITRPDVFKVQQQLFYEKTPLVADGFYARRENFLVFSAERLDESYKALMKATTDIWQGDWSMEKLLKGGGHKGAQAEEVVKNQMIALLVKCMQEESVLATVTHEATRQLMEVTGKFPPNVEVPQWIQFGMGSFFETPVGSYWAGIGVPSWRYFIIYKYWEESKKIELCDPSVLRSIVTDEVFRVVATLPPNQRKAALTKARTLSWSLTYFLASENRLDGLLRYFEELNQLPRDLEFDDDALFLIFARAFDLLDPNNPNLVSSVKLKQFTQEWCQFMHYSPIEASEAYVHPTEINTRLENGRPGVQD